MAAETGSFAWVNHLKNERIVRTKSAVEASLSDAARLQGETQVLSSEDRLKWGEALSAAKPAKSLLEQGEADGPLVWRVNSVLDQVVQGQADATHRWVEAEHNRALLARLEEIRQNRDTEGDRIQIHANRRMVDQAYATAFREFGVDLESLDAKVAGRSLAENPKWNWRLIRFQGILWSGSIRKQVTLAGYVRLSALKNTGNRIRP